MSVLMFECLSSGRSKTVLQGDGSLCEPTPRTRMNGESHQSLNRNPKGTPDLLIDDLN